MLQRARSQSSLLLGEYGRVAWAEESIRAFVVAGAFFEVGCFIELAGRLGVIGMFLIPMVSYIVIGRYLGVRRLWDVIFRIDLVAVKGKSAKGMLLSAEVGDGVVIAHIVFSQLCH